jgi:uncharacterized protein YjbI with pentapeptide repeats
MALAKFKCADQTIQFLLNFTFAPMQTLLYEDQTFTKITANQLTGSIYENCKFISCDFSNASFVGITFVDCHFDTCNLLLADLGNTGLQNIRFKHCKISGVNFGKANDFLFEVHFEDCILDNAVFYKKKNKKAIYTVCSMIETDLTEADLSDCKFINCNLKNAFFNRTVLKNADLSTSFNFIIDPDDNIIKKAKFSLHGLPGLLAKYDIRIG